MSIVFDTANKDDMIANIIPSEINLARYGYEYTYSIDDLLRKYEKFVNHDYKCFFMDGIKEEMLNLISSREDLYLMPNSYIDNKAQSFNWNSEILARAARETFVLGVENTNVNGYVDVSEVFEDDDLGWGFKWKAIPSLLLNDIGQFMVDKKILNTAPLFLVFPGLANVLLPKLPEVLFGVQPIAYPHMPDCYWVLLSSHN